MSEPRRQKALDDADDAHGTRCPHCHGPVDPSAVGCRAHVVDGVGVVAQAGDKAEAPE